MKTNPIVYSAILPALVVAGFGASSIAARMPASDIPAELAAAPHCRVANIPAQALSPEATKTYEEAAPPLWDDLGTLAYQVTTKTPEAQRYFDQGIRLAANFNHAEARRAFRKAQSLDADCAMCFAAEALVLGPNINAPMTPEANAQAIAAIGKAKQVAAGASDKEKGLIEAVAARYSDNPADERPKLDAAFADAMVKLSDRFPDDLELAVMAAEADMDTQPWDYWEPDGKQAKGRTADALKRLEAVLAKAPDHPWAIHLYIHLVEASDDPERAEPYADRLAALMPGAGHIVHMPSHVYHRIGRYADALQSNKDASLVDETYITKTGAQGVYPVGYYSHNVHFVLITAQMLGDRELVLEQADKLDKWLSNEVATAVPFAQPIKAAPYFAWAQYAEPDKVLAMAKPAGAPPYVEAIWHYARGVAHAAKKDTAAALTEADAIQKIASDTDWATLDAWAIPARPVLEVAQRVVRARAAQADDDAAAAIAEWNKAAEAEDTIPYMEPPFWYYPVRQSLGAALLKTGKPDEAEKEFSSALEHARGSAWALYGLKEAAKARGDADGEKKANDNLAKAWKGDPALLSLERL